MVYKDSKKAKIIKIFQQEAGALASKIIHPELTILSYVVKLWAQLGKIFYKNFFEWFCYLNMQGWPKFLSLGGQYYDLGHPSAVVKVPGTKNVYFEIYLLFQF